MKKLLAVIIFIMVIIASFAIGLSVGKRKAVTQAKVVVDSVQADLLFNRILIERKMQLMLSKGCVTETKSELIINEDQDTKLLADLFKGELTLDARKYIYDRDPVLANALSTFKSKYGNSWKEMACTK